MNRSEDQEDAEVSRRPLPFPESLCHRCGAPPRYVRTDKGAVFIQCPVLKRYPPQPVLSCDEFRPRT